MKIIPTNATLQGDEFITPDGYLIDFRRADPTGPNEPGILICRMTGADYDYNYVVDGPREMSAASAEALLKRLRDRLRDRAPLIERVAG